MNELNARVKELRIYYGLTMDDFGKRLGLSQSSISAIEYSNRPVTEKHIKLLCAAFPEVNERWLRDGEGEMLVDTRDSFIDELVRRYDMDDLDRRMVEGYLNLSQENRKVMKDYLHSLLDASAKLDPAAALEARIDAEAEEYKRQRLLEEKAKGGSSRSADGNVSEVG